MFTHRLHMMIAAILMVAACASEDRPEKNAHLEDSQAADIVIYTGGTIYTGVDETPMAEAVAVANGVILAVGSREIVESAATGDVAIYDLNGATMYPGFTDAHAHLLGIGMRELTLNLEDIGSINELVSTVAERVQQAEDGETVTGRGWIETGWPEGRMPTRVDLDPISRNNPVILFRADGHAAAVNSATLVAAGIDDMTPDPEGGRIERDEFGRATGILIDDAMGLLSDLMTAPSTERKREAYGVASDVYGGYGWTGIHNMSVDPNDVKMIETLSSNGAVDIRVYNALDPAGFDMLETDGPRASNNAKVLTQTVKLYVDGALGSRGALLAEPYSDAPETSGLLRLTEEDAKGYFNRAIPAGIQIVTHAIGDKGNTLVLDWYEDTFAENQDAGGLRWRIEHAQILDTDDIARFAALEVIPSMQPSHAIGDLFFAPDRLGQDRLDGAYPWRALIDAGAIIPGGSDAPVERGNPLIEFYAAVARRGLDGTQNEDWRPEQAVTRAEALKMFTIWPAYASFQENLLGTIEPGKRADFTAFSKDIMVVPEAEILTAKPVLTIVDGEIIYKKN